MKIFLRDDILRLGTYYRYLVIKKLQLPIDGRSLLDIGGYDGYLLSGAIAESKTVIDMDPKNAHKDIRYIKDDFLSHDFHATQFDRVFAFDVLEHIKEERLFLNKILGMLEPGSIALLSTPSKSIRIFPSFLQSYVDKRWGHIYRRGYSAIEIESMIEKDNYDASIMTWNCPAFRFFYLPLSVLWRVMPGATTNILQLIAVIDNRYKNGDKGFLFIMVRKK